MVMVKFIWCLFRVWKGVDDKKKKKVKGGKFPIESFDKKNKKYETH
jgi:hypothetical protein